MDEAEMKEEIYLGKEFEKRFKEANIKIADCRYYCNEGVVYEFNSRNDLMKAQAIYFPLALRIEDGFRVEFTSVDNVHHMFAKYLPDLD